jgi:16S rRNA U516 pseudouridylate synthase RsuA-like enzyme
VETVREASGATYGQAAVGGLLNSREQPDSRRSGEITIRRGMDKSTAFTDWIKKTLAEGKPDEARQDVTIVVVDARQTPVRRITARDAVDVVDLMRE